jgi:hypothetical protein
MFVPNSSAILDWLKDPRSAMSAPFMPVDVPRQARSRKLAERGAEDGARNAPATDLSLAEQEIVTDISADRERCARDLASSLRAYRDGLSGLQTGMDVAGLRHAADEAILHFHEINARWKGDVGELRSRAAQVTSELDEFKAQHRLRRAPRLPENRLLSFSLLCVFVVAESIANGLFFASGSDLGLLGGIMLALALSATNVVTGTLAGFVLLRQKNRTNWLAGSLGFATFLGVATAIVVFNGFVAHYRDIYQAAGDATKVSDAWSGLITATFGLSSLYSWLLFGMGVFFSGAAAWKGYGLDDPYPGYGSTERRRIDATRRYNDERISLIDEAGEIADEYSQKALRAMETLRASSSQRQQLLGARARALAEYAAHENDLAQAAQQLLTIYREANTARRTVPPPAHFSQRFTFPLKALDRPEFGILLSDQGMEHDAETLIQELDGLRRRVLNEHTSVLVQAPGEV